MTIKLTLRPRCRVESFHPLWKILVKKEDFLRCSVEVFLCAAELINLAPSRIMEPRVSLCESNTLLCSISIRLDIKSPPVNCGREIHTHILVNNELCANQMITNAIVLVARSILRKYQSSEAKSSATA